MDLQVEIEEIADWVEYGGGEFLEGGLPIPTFKTPKCALSADALRATGNAFFKKGKFNIALNFYNASLCDAPPGSEHIALAYGNRSAVYCEMGKYALAIKDIEMARKGGFPAEKMEHLDARKQKCKELMEKLGPDISFDANSFFKLSHPPNEKIPFIADCLELRQNEKYGRYIITNKDLEAGDIIAVENPVFSCHNGLQLGIACSYCTKSNSKNLFPCLHCTTAMYCSEKCQLKAVLLHYNDGFSKIYSGTFKMSLKMQLEAFCIAGGVDELLELLKDSENKTIFDFDFSDPDDPSYKKNMLIAMNGLCKNVKRGEMPEIKPDQLLNVPPINEKPRTAEEREQLIKFIISQYQICDSNVAVQPGGHFGIYLLHSLMNHSCLPNVVYWNFDDKLVSIVATPVKAGEQIFCSYGCCVACHTTEQRSGLLRDYPFKCDCEACVNDFSRPKNDLHFVEQKFEKLEPEAAIEQFKKNCSYINENAGKMPCYEITRLVDQNSWLIQWIAGNNPQ